MGATLVVGAITAMLRFSRARRQPGWSFLLLGGVLSLGLWTSFTVLLAGLLQLSAAEFRRATEVTYLGYVYATQPVLPRMKARDRGAIVHVGSALAYGGYRCRPRTAEPSTPSRFHEALRCELLHEGSNVRVTMIQMPVVNTPQFSSVLSRLSRPSARAAQLRAGDGRPGGGVRRRPPAPPGVLGRLQHHGNPGRQCPRAGAA